MRIPILAFAAASLSACAILAENVAGKITFKGAPPAEMKIDFKGVDSCGKLHKTKTTQHYVVGKDGGLANVFIHIKDPGQTNSGAASAPLLLDQKDCEYSPYVAGALVGQKIIVRNSDPLMHNVRTAPDRKSGNPAKNLAQMPKGKDLEYVFHKPEMFLKYTCDVHPWMFAYVSVMPHSFFAVSGLDGGFTITNLPPGEYTLEASHRKAGTKEVKVKVVEGKPTVLNLEFEAKPETKP